MISTLRTEQTRDGRQISSPTLLPNDLPFVTKVTSPLALLTLRSSHRLSGYQSGGGVAPVPSGPAGARKPGCSLFRLLRSGREEGDRIFPLPTRCPGRHVSNTSGSRPDDGARRRGFSGRKGNGKSGSEILWRSSRSSHRRCGRSTGSGRPQNRLF